MGNRRQIGRRSRSARERRGRVALRRGVFLAGLMLASAAQATLLKFPKTDPRVALEIPDNWTASYTAVGLELQSPAKDSLVVAGIVNHDEHSVETWAKAANKVLGAEGVVFAKKGKPTRTLIPKPPADPTVSAAPQSSSGEAFGFSGTPSVAPPFSQGKDEFAAMIAKMKGPATPYKVVQTFGATLDSKPVDIELAMYTLSDDRLFVIEQQSGQTDGRATAIVKSYRPLQ